MGFFKRAFPVFLLILLAAAGSTPLLAQSGEAALKLPDLHTATFFGVSGPTLLMFGLGVSALGFVFGFMRPVVLGFDGKQAKKVAACVAKIFTRGLRLG